MAFQLASQTRSTAGLGFPGDGDDGESVAGPIRLLFVDPDDAFRVDTQAELERLGFAVASFTRAAELLTAVADGVEADIAVVDWTLANVGGVAVLRRLRRHGFMLPVVFVSSQTYMSWELLAFDSGAHDFVDKGRGLPILAKRLRLVFQSSQRSRGMAGTQTLSGGRLLLEAGLSRAFWNGINLDLTASEFRVVRLLASHAKTYITYDAVYDCARRADIEGSEGRMQINVRGAVKRIRGKFRRVDPAFDGIENYPSFGYCWTAS